MCIIPECEWTEYIPDCCETGTLKDPYLGTFEQGPHTRWCHQGALPQPVDKDKPQFWVSSPNKFTNHTIDYTSIVTGVKTLDIDTTRDLWILIHGFSCEWPKTWMFPMQNALLAKGHNVILVRWSGNGKDSGGSCAPDYFQATANTRVMGAVVARLVKLLLSEKPPKADLSKTSILGFSLGAHVAGYAGGRLPGLKQVVGMDPAGPLYGFCDPSTRLNHTNAKFVQAIHCNGEPICCGSLQQMGDIDFYANGGKFQPGCGYNEHKPLSFNPGCSHERCPYLFTTSILNDDGNADTCRYQSFPISDQCTNPTQTGPTDWAKGDCFKNCDQHLGCAVPGYSTTIGSPFSGVHYFGTLENDKSNYQYCGRTYKIVLTAGSTCGSHLAFRCTITAQLNGKNFKSWMETLVDETTFETDATATHIMMYGWATPDNSVTVPDTVTICFSSSWVFDKHFNVKNIHLIRDDGALFQTTTENEVERNKCADISLHGSADR